MTTEANRRAQAAMQRADWAGALKTFAEVLAKNPDDVAALMYCGIARVKWRPFAASR
jgi:Flp pilus assembly protein TadD